MALKKIVNNVEVEMTPEEEAAFAEERSPKQPTVAQYTSAVQEHLDARARGENYDNILSACSYAGAPNPFQEEGCKFVEWRGNVWATCYQIMELVNSNQRPAPTIPQLISELPELVL